MCGFGLPVKRRVTLSHPPSGNVSPLVEDNGVKIFGADFQLGRQPCIFVCFFYQNHKEKITIALVYSTPLV